MQENLVTEQETGQSPIQGKHWIYLAAVVFIGIITAMLVPVLFGQQLHPLAIYYSVFLATLSFATIWWYRGKSVWAGAGMGAALGISMFLFAELVSRMV